MKIRDAVSSDFIFLDLEADDASRALAAVADEIGGAAKLDREQVRTALEERETLGSTSVGNGFAIPHCKLTDLEDIVVGLARFREGVDFGNRNGGDKVRFFFVVLSPPDQPTEHLQVLSQIARILKSETLRGELLNAEDGNAVLASIRRAAEAEGL